MRLTKFLGGLVAAATLFAAPQALAQKAEILVMNQAEVIAKSKAGQSIQTQITALAQTASKELEAEGKKLQSEGQALQASKDSMKKDDLTKRVQQLQAQQAGAQRLGQIRQAEVSQAEAQALSQLAESLEPVVRDIMKKRKAKIVLRRTDVAVMDDAVDITDEVIKALDKKVTSITVTKPDLIAQARAAQAQAQ